MCVKRVSQRIGSHVIEELLHGLGQTAAADARTLAHVHSWDVRISGSKGVASARADSGDEKKTLLCLALNRQSWTRLGLTASNLG